MKKTSLRWYHFHIFARRFIHEKKNSHGISALSFYFRSSIFCGGGYNDRKFYISECPEDFSASGLPGDVPAHVLPDNDVIIENIEALSQHPDYPTGCESVSLYILLRHYGVEISVEDIVEALPKGPVPYGTGDFICGADPETEFVGDPREEGSYGVFEKPIAETAEKFLSGAKSKAGASIDDITNLISDGSPVIAWCSISEDQNIEYRREWTVPSTGKIVSWPGGEHAVVVYGFSETELYISDPNTGTLRTVLISEFEPGFNDLGGRIVYYE